MRILGISAFYHDSAAALIDDGKVVAAAQEERFTRRKHDPAFPEQAVRYCLRQGGLDLDGVDYVVFFEKPFLKFERLLETYLANAPHGFRSFRKAIPIWVKDKLFQKSGLEKTFKALSPTGKDIGDRLLFAEHHQSHAASAFFPSPFDEAIVLTMDGVGEWATTSAAVGRGNKLEMVREIRWPHSLGLLYSALTYYTGFRVNSGEYKLMGLAPYGEPKYAELLWDNVIDVKPDGSFWLDQSYFNYATGLTMTSRKFEKLLGAPPRSAEATITQRDMDLAASIQKITEDIILRISDDLAESYGVPNLCLAGGVALNCVANGKALRHGKFKNIWIQPAAGDAGGALGAALAAYHTHLNKPRIVERDRSGTYRDGMLGSYLGPEFSQEEIESRLTDAGAKYEAVSKEDMLAKAVDSLVNGDAVGWFQGRMEFGPRSLGARAILGDPRNPDMQKRLNLKIKFRESFRPFAPSVLAEDVGDYFEHDTDSPYMLLVAQVRKSRRIALTPDQETLFGIEKLNVPRSDIPAITHVDYSARLQTVQEDTNPLYYKLLQAFKARTDCAVLVNTSFNVRGEPIVCTPEDAFRCFMGTGLETLAIGNCILRKDAQDPSLIEDYTSKFQLD